MGNNNGMTKEGYLILAHILRDIDSHAIDLKMPDPDKDTVETIARIILCKFGNKYRMFPHDMFRDECGVTWSRECL